MRILSSLVLLLFVVSAAVAQEAPPPPPPADPAPAPAVPKLARMKLGEFWYGMYTADGTTEGYARMQFRDTLQKGVHCAWELHISGDGWTYEEDRQTTFDAYWQLTYSEMSSGGQRILAAREGNVMVGKSGIDDLRAEVKPDATTGMGFILAACLDQKEGATLSRTEYDEANNLAEIGKSTISCGAQETIELPEGKVKAWKYTVQGQADKTLPVWVNDAREIVQVDWGTGNLMKLHHESTKELFNPAPPFLKQLDADDKTKLVLTADFAGFTMDEMWDLWATGKGLAKWWPQEAEVGNEIGGKYQPTWKNEKGEIIWQLLGTIEVWEPKKRLGFTWKWNTDPEDAPTLHVLVALKEIEGGVNVKITHYKFDPLNEDQINRNSLKGGWEMFCSKIPQLKDKPPEEGDGG